MDDLYLNKKLFQISKFRILRDNQVPAWHSCIYHKRSKTLLDYISIMHYVIQHTKSYIQCTIHSLS